MPFIFSNKINMLIS